MFRYEDARTTSIVNRLVAIGNKIRAFTIFSWAAILGAVFSATASFIDLSIWWVGAIIGIILGVMIGMYIAALVTVLFE